jgi:Kef-type K+ transport system membrane component KefB
MTFDMWIAVASVALPLIAKAASDWSANTTAGHNAALARIVGMAGRQAASAARVLATTKPGEDSGKLERALIQTAAETVVAEMGGSMATVGATPGLVARIVQGELDKLVVAPIAVLPATIAAPASVR